MEKIWVQYLSAVVYVPFLKLCYIDFFSPKIMSYEFLFHEIEVYFIVKQSHD